MNTSRRIITLALPLLLAAGALAGQPDPDSSIGAADPQAQIQALLREHEDSDLGYAEAYNKFRPQFEAFVKDHRGTEAEARATLWLVQQAWWLRTEGKMEETAWPLAKDLIERHPKSPQLGLLVEYQYVFEGEQREELFEKLIEVSPHPEVKAAAHFGLARLSSARTEDGEPNPHFEALIEEYADVPWRSTTFGAIANAYLNPHSPEALEVGKTAPEIVGVNHKGQPMRLSDFRGKVVMLDFWGHW